MSSERQFLIEGVLLSVIGLFGVFGNIAAIVYFGRAKWRKQRFYALMLTRAIVDIMVIVSFIWFFSVPEFLASTRTSFRWSVWLYPVINMSCTGSIYLTVAISLERYLAICKPLIYHDNQWSIKRYLIPIFFISIVYNIPTMFEFEWIEFTAKINGTDTKFTFGTMPTELKGNRDYDYIYTLWCDVIFRGIIPIALLISLNLMILNEMKRYKCYMNGDQNEEITRQVQLQMAEINLIIVAIFIICHVFRHIPPIHQLSYHNEHNPAGKCPYKDTIYSIGEVSEVVVVLNSSLSFYVYLFKYWIVKH